MGVGDQVASTVLAEHEAWVPLYPLPGTSGTRAALGIHMDDENAWETCVGNSPHIVAKSQKTKALSLIEE